MNSDRKKTIGGRPKRANEVADQIERLIGDEFRVGDRLPTEKKLMERFGVGRPAVREGLFLLQQQGLVEVVNGTRARVSAPSPNLFIKQFANFSKRLTQTAEGQEHGELARLVLEAGNAWLAATVATNDDIDRLKSRLEANASAVGDRVEFIRTDVAFHYELAVITQNPIFKMIYEVMVDWLIEQRTTTYLLLDADGFSVRDHTAIYEAVAARDPARAFHEMASHIQLIGRLHREVAKLSSDVLRSVTSDVAGRFEREKAARWATSFGGAATMQPAPSSRPSTAKSSTAKLSSPKPSGSKLK